MTIGRNPGLEYPYSHISLEELSKFYHDHWLISKYGKYLLKVFGEDFVKEQIFACNLCKCSTPKNAVLMDCEIKHCRPYLDEQISIVKPKIILIFGTEVANEYVGKGNWEYLQKISINNMTVFVCRHPAYFTYKHDPKSDLQDKEQTRVLRTIKEFVCQL
jgi:uracil-DNA glycosylase family 4